MVNINNAIDVLEFEIHVEQFILIDVWVAALLLRPTPKVLIVMYVVCWLDQTCVDFANFHGGEDGPNRVRYFTLVIHLGPVVFKIGKDGLSLIHLKICNNFIGIARPVESLALFLYCFD